ncbi:UPF0103-domain-containing protein [Coemansia reversa NRRL 1564]|uniref:UPF0103-domain-containing protein n=1 Tax=Coemansia reversa (strain ATCC 12441 / NRRL 1564) TaxID=763665 RepID=A0A2G5BH77_COERN|nr:UPF0103-domain-containing protein [Coemansia reversa NRRL 1564]|eukprot:PIA18378.1 UPF0103-domain-containing protein [Coemansia reversa NRRL 1564]
MVVRSATHAGSWYSGSGKDLDQELKGWLDEVPKEMTEVEPAGGLCKVPVKGARAIIGPHAGFSYSGPNAAYGYQCINTENIKRVFLLGPSHHAYLEKCALSRCTEYETPLGNIQVDREMLDELQSKGDWDLMSLKVDEDEHSLEMHLPYIYKVFEQHINEIKLVPILVGNLRFGKEHKYGEILAPYLADKQNFFVISSDFCHWGSRFGYTLYKESDNSRAVMLSRRSDRPAGVPVWQSIERLDFAGMEAIAHIDHARFKQYLDETENTICGRHPIGVLLAAVNALYPIGEQGSESPRLRFVKYDQSNRVESVSGSSVSYASAYLWFPDPPSSKKTQDSTTDSFPDNSSSVFDALTPAQREDIISEAEWGFRNWLRTSGSQTGYVMYPSTRQIFKSLQILNETIDNIDFSDIAK